MRRAPSTYPCFMNYRNLVTRIAVGMVVSLFLGVRALALPPAPAPPPFPVGRIAAYPTIVQTGTKPTLVWSVDLPANTNEGDYAFFIRQEQIPSGIIWDMPVDRTGETTSHLAINPGAAEFELWAVGGPLVKAYLLDTTVAGPYLPMATVTLRSEDPYPVLPRTRADRPFYVDVTVHGLFSDEAAPPESKGVTLTNYVQSYGETGTGADLDRDQATFLSQSSITTDGTRTFTFTLNSIPGADRTKVRGEERLSVFSREGYQMPASVIASKFIQVWPVANGMIAGITQGLSIGAAVPEITLHLTDLYPSSTTYAQVYKGSPQLNTTGTVVPGSTITLNDSIPANRVLTLSNYGAVFDSVGLWTMELLTRTPFGTDRLSHVSFTVQSLGVTIESWRQAHFGSIDNSGDGADLNDFDKDGLANLVEYAFGFDPKQTSAGLLPAPQKSGNNFLFNFTQPSAVSGILYGAEWSTTLLPDSWVPIADTAVPPQHLFSVPIDTKPTLYLRLKVTGQ